MVIEKGFKYRLLNKETGFSVDFEVVEVRPNYLIVKDNKGSFCLNKQDLKNGLSNNTKNTNYVYYEIKDKFKEHKQRMLDAM